VVRIATETARQWLRANPEAKIVSISQNDCGGACQCPNCRALAAQEGSESGPLLHFVNQVADNLKAEFPDVAVDTLAYQYTRKPPKTERPRPNVIIRLCSIECCFAHPLDTCDNPTNQAFCADARGWSAICNRLYVWDYTTIFSNYFVPFPNFDSLGANVRFFVDNHVKGIFEEGCYTTKASPFVELRAYLNARCLWDPACDARQTREEFLRAFYGPAAPYMDEYIDLFQDKVKRDDIHVSIWAPPTSPYLPKDLVLQADAILAQGEAAVAANPVLLLRVQKERLSTRYVMLERPGEFGLAGAPLGQMVDEFGRVARLCGVTQMNEGTSPLEGWLAAKR
jgi:hypothetical protein